MDHIQALSTGHPSRRLYTFSEEARQIATSLPSDTQLIERHYAPPSGTYDFPSGGTVAPMDTVGPGFPTMPNYEDTIMSDSDDEVVEIDTQKKKSPRKVRFTLSEDNSSNSKKPKASPTKSARKKIVKKPRSSTSSEKTSKQSAASSPRKQSGSGGQSPTKRRR
ncbi:hypothetical protein C8Q75DRAFT_804493 [Abortiporus biennis]|nr:hypothetical protein C8Q75DRAFT_804493 [Abortiporus biennis]